VRVPIRPAVQIADNVRAPSIAQNGAVKIYWRERRDQRPNFGEPRKLTERISFNK